jgi:peptidoglycan/xylan/chitin deacetylase (PgdA/CDA1 family)
MAQRSVTTIRQIPSIQKSLYLTFDDGPLASCTEGVLEVLSQHKIPATFFLVAEKAQRNPDLVHKILKHGHQIGNHSLDHRYSVFFKGEKALRNWICESEDIFHQLGIQTIGFRPPAGVRTPELFRALKQLDIPLILWNTRFYDSIWSWTKAKAEKSLTRLQAGDIVLLHDAQKNKKFPTFLSTLDFYLNAAQAKGFQFRPIDLSFLHSR